MTTQRTLLAATLLVAFISVGAKAGIVGSAHDFSSYGWSKNQICLPCHAPHQAAGSENYKAGILWNHELTKQTTGLKFDLYSSSGLHTGTTDLDTGSILCMSCHDGTVALDSFGGTIKTSANGQFIGGKYLKGANGDLTGSHPVGTEAVYRTNNDGQLSTSTSFADPKELSANGYRVNLRKITGATDTTTGVTAYTYVVGCGTCHNPHNGLHQANGEGMLRVPQTGNVVVGGTSYIDKNGVPQPTKVVYRPAGSKTTVPGSGLCLTCHIK
jgi:hypothetical protein